MTDEDVVRRCKEIAGGRVNGPYQKGEYKPQWRWDLNVHKETIAWMTRLHPLMGTRRQAQIDACLEAYEGKEEIAHADRTHCPYNHPHDEENTYLRTNANGGTSRQCKTCRKLRQRQYVEAQRSALINTEEDDDLSQLIS